MPKYIFVTGGVMSGLGKGTTTASIAKLLQLSGIEVTCIKIDPYLNYDAGTMNPFAHGEVFVTDDGGETDMDIGTYERFLNRDLSKRHNITTGQIYKKVLEDERKGLFLGKSVQIIPHITDEIKRRIREIAETTNAEIIVVECGGTVGDIESLPFLEALRQMRMEEGVKNTLFIHVSLAPELSVVGEMKTKPTQHSVQEMRRIGIQPDIIVVRGSKKLPQEAKEKIALFASVDVKSVISNPDVNSIYQVPLILYREGILGQIKKKLRLRAKTNIRQWKLVVDGFIKTNGTVKVVLVGKYASLADSYVSVNHAIMHAAALERVKPVISHLESEDIESDIEAVKKLEDFDGIIIPQGFGKRGTEGKIVAANYAREKMIPFLGLCFGFQLAVVSFARYVVGLDGANSTEIDPNTPYPVIDILPEQRNIVDLGGTMRLGGHDIYIKKGTVAHRIYGREVIRERHRHRYEVNPSYIMELESKGIVFSAFSDNGRRAEILEIPSHPFYLATQYHPEYISRPERPEPIFVHFIKSCLERKAAKKELRIEQLA